MNIKKKKKQERRNTKQRSMEHGKNSGTPRNSGGTTEKHSKHQRHTSGTRGITKPYKTKNNCSASKRKFKPLINNTFNTFNSRLKHFSLLI